MNVAPECFPCFFRQTIIALNQAGAGADIQRAVLREVAGIVGGADLAGSPAHLTSVFHRRIRDLVGGDPFRAVKAEYNRKALELYDTLKQVIEDSEDPLLTATRLAIAGNIIDFGIYTAIDMEGTVRKALDGPIAVDAFRRFRDDVVHAGEILYLLDNAGEIVFDRLLIETIGSIGPRVTAVVKGSAIINDATREDAAATGLNGVCAVIDNGSDAVGTILKWSSPGFREAFARAELIISKGQGNFETLMHERRDATYFLFQAKCDVVARYLGLEKGAMLLAGGADLPCGNEPVQAYGT